MLRSRKVILRTITSGRECALELADPKFAASIGIMLNFFALIEREVPGLLAKIFPRMSNEEAFIILGSFTSFSHRVRLVRFLAEAKPKRTRYAKNVGKFAKLLEEANVIRNRYVHSHFMMESPNKLVIESFLSDARRKSILYDITLATMAKDLRRVKAAYWRLKNYAMSGQRSYFPPVHKVRRRASH